MPAGVHVTSLGRTSSQRTRTRPPSSSSRSLQSGYITRAPSHPPLHSVVVISSFCLLWGEGERERARERSSREASRWSSNEDVGGVQRAGGGGAGGAGGGGQPDAVAQDEGVRARRALPGDQLPRRRVRAPRRPRPPRLLPRQPGPPPPKVLYCYIRCLLRCGPQTRASAMDGRSAPRSTQSAMDGQTWYIIIKIIKKN